MFVGNSDPLFRYPAIDFEEINASAEVALRLAFLTTQTSSLDHEGVPVVRMRFPHRTWNAAVH
jgi:hypothetical protein